MSIEDIEDISTNLNRKSHENSSKNGIRIRVNPRYRKDDLNDNNDTNNDQELQSFLPGKHSIWIRTWGCTHNSSDTEYMAGLLAASGYRIVETAEYANVWILNSCTVKNPAEDHFRNDVMKAMKAGKKLIVAGCVPQGQQNTSYLKNISVIGVQQIDRVVDAVEETLKGNVVRYLSVKKDGKRKTGGASLNMPKIRKNPLIEIIPINTGCLNECTYCKTKHARGKLGSYKIEEIIERAEVAFSEGVKELWITSEDTGAYGRDIGTNLPELLKKLVEVIPDGCMLRIGMTNPPYIMEHLEDIATILRHPRVYSFLHIPVQAGSDAVLTDMKREYCVADFQYVVEYLKEKVPGISIATDIICGFPTETANDFNETMKLIQKYKFPSLFINQFYPRPNTPAAKMQRVADPQEVKCRSKMASDFFKSYSTYDGRIGKRYTVLVTEEATDKKHYVAHNKFYEHILVSKDDCLMGETFDLEIVNTSKFNMIGKRINDGAGSLYRLRRRIQRHRAAIEKILFISSISILSICFLLRLKRSL